MTPVDDQAPPQLGPVPTTLLLKTRLTLNAETRHFESKEETSFSLAKEVTTRARARLAPW